MSWPLVVTGDSAGRTNDQPNHVVATANGFVTTNGSTTWENNFDDSRNWTQSFGSTNDLAVDTTGTIYVPNGTKISKLASDGALIGDITLDGQTKIKQIKSRQPTSEPSETWTHFTTTPDKKDCVVRRAARQRTHVIRQSLQAPMTSNT